jgi:hypothetical protein
MALQQMLLCEEDWFGDKGHSRLSVKMINLAIRKLPLLRPLSPRHYLDDVYR